MVRSGKERAAPSSASVADADDATTQDTRWLQGVNRQLRSDAPSHQQNASLAAVAKRKANAMTGEEKAAADRARADRRNEAKRAKRAVATASVAAAAAEQVAESGAPVVEVAALGRLERIDFEDWLARKELPFDDASLEDWRMSDSYERTKRERIIEGCTCFLSPNGGKRMNVLPYDELKRRVDDGVLQAGDSFDVWDERVLADRKARRVSIGEYFERPWAFAWCGAFRQCTCTYDGHGDEARVMPDIPGQNCDAYNEEEARRLLEPQAGDWQPSGGDWVPEGWDGAEPGGSEPDAPPPPLPPPTFPPQHPPAAAPADDDAYELDQERMLEEQGRISAIHGRPWHEVAIGATESRFIGSTT